MHHPPVADIQAHFVVDHNPRPNEIAFRDPVGRNVAKNLPKKAGANVAMPPLARICATTEHNGFILKSSDQSSFR
jgi:hypothetical protein